MRLLEIKIAFHRDNKILNEIVIPSNAGEAEIIERTITSLVMLFRASRLIKENEGIIIFKTSMEDD